MPILLARGCGANSYSSIKRLFFTYSCFRQIPQHGVWCMGPFAGVDYNLTFCRIQHMMYHGQRFASESTSTLCQSRSTLNPSQGLRIWPRDNSPAPQYFKAVLWIRRPNYQSLTGRYIVDYDKPIPELTYNSQSGTKNLAPGLYCPNGSGIFVPDPNLTCSTRKCVQFLQIFLQNGFFKKILQTIKCLCSSPVSNT
jgi:hypothetical protein